MSYKRKNNYNANYNKKKFTKKVEPGLSGFLCTCESKLNEKSCVREAYNLLNEFADEMYGPQDTNWRNRDTTEQEPPVYDPGEDDETEEDIDAALLKEVETLKAVASKKPEDRRFQVVESGAKGVVFIKSTVPDPVKLANKIITTVAETKQQRSKFLLRLIPVEITCKASMDVIVTSCDSLFDKYFTAEPTTFSIVYTHRNNDSLSRTDLIDKIAALVSKKNPAHKVDLKHASLAIIVEVICSICMLSVVPDYFSLKKYNLLELANSDNKKAKSEEEEGKAKEDNEEKQNELVKEEDKIEED